MIGRFGGGPVNVSAGEALGCLFFIFLPITALFTGSGFIGAAIYIAIGLFIPFVYHKWQERKWKETDLSQLYEHLSRSKYTNLFYIKNLDDVPRFYDSYKILELRLDKWDNDISIATISDSKRHIEIKLTPINTNGYRSGSEIGSTRLIDTKVLRVRNLKFEGLHSLYSEGYLIFHR